MLGVDPFCCEISLRLRGEEGGVRQRACRCEADMLGLGHPAEHAARQERRGAAPKGVLSKQVDHAHGTPSEALSRSKAASHRASTSQGMPERGPPTVTNGCAVAAVHKTRRRSCRKIRRPKSKRKEMVGTTKRSIAAMPSA